MSKIVFNEHYYTKEEATRLLDNDLTDKEFWLVDDYDNIHILQSVLDVLFNANFPDNRIYVGDYLQSQNSIRLIIKCQVCSKDLSSFDPFMGHDKGKQHKKAVQQTFTQCTESPNLSGPITFKSQNEPVINFEPNSLEDQLSQTKHSVLGFQFIYAEIVHGKEYFYTCQLCSARRLTKEESFVHIIGDKHILKFLNVKYGLQHSNFDDAYEAITKVSILEGKISAPILTYHHSDIEQTLKRRPVSSPTMSQIEREIEHYQESQTNALTRSTASFLAELKKLQSHFNNCDIQTSLLKNDKVAFQLTTDLIKKISVKLAEYSKMDDAFLIHADNLFRKASDLSLSLD